MNALLAIDILSILLSADFILGVVILAFAIYGLLKGFAAQLFGFIGSIAALILASCFSKSLLNVLLENTEWAQGISDSLYGSVESALGSLGQITSGQITSAAESLPLPESVKSSVIAYAESMGAGADINFASVVANVLAEYILLFLCFVVLFFGIKLLALIFKGLFAALVELPILKQLDKILGLVLALLKAWVLISGFVFLLNLLSFSALDGIREALDNSAIYAAISKINLFDFILSLLTI